jgi:hypothetical protein
VAGDKGLQAALDLKAVTAGLLYQVTLGTLAAVAVAVAQARLELLVTQLLMVGTERTPL